MRISHRLAEIKSWTGELWALAGSNLFFAAIVVLLVFADGKPIFTWKGVTLNTAISVLAVCMKASLLFAVSECIAQWKWILFSRAARRPLIDFEHIDRASRGPLGSVKVLFWAGGS